MAFPTAVLGLQRPQTHLPFYLGAGHSNSGPYTCTASTLIQWAIFPIPMLMCLNNGSLLGGAVWEDCGTTEGKPWYFIIQPDFLFTLCFLTVDIMWPATSWSSHHTQPWWILSPLVSWPLLFSLASCSSLTPLVFSWLSSSSCLSICLPFSCPHSNRAFHSPPPMNLMH